jgi:hypothetical protein
VSGEWTAADYARDASDQTEDANQGWRAEYAAEDTYDDNQPTRAEADADAALDAADDARTRPDPWATTYRSPAYWCPSCETPKYIGTPEDRCDDCNYEGTKR